MRKLKRFALKRKVLLLRTAAIVVPMIMALLLLSQTAFAKNTYVITDGSRVFTYTTFATDPAVVLGEAGLELGEDDTYTTQPGPGVPEITVQRSQSVTIEYYGEVIPASTMGETVEQLLTRLNISLGEKDVVSQPLNEDTFDGMVIRVERVLKTEETYSSTVAHEVTYCYDSSLPEGVQEVLTEGVDGELLCTAAVTYVNGRETERTILTTNMTMQPVTELIAIGSGASADTVNPGAMPVIGDGTITLPTGEVLTYTASIQCGATAYYNRGTTATGTQARPGVVAVDPRFIPHGTRMFIITNDGQFVYGLATAEDAGDGNIVGTRIDLWFPTKWECDQFGFRDCTVYLLGSD